MEKTSPGTAITAQTRQISWFFPLLAKGIQIPCTGTISLLNFLQSALKLNRDYIENRLQTIFLNGRAVDDLDRTIIDAGMTLALSAAMPGLVGATFRRAGRYATLRQTVSHKTDVPTHVNKSGRITLKLFNFIAKEIGPNMLSRGFFVICQDFAALIEKQWQNLQQDNCRILIKGQKAAKEDLMGILTKEKSVFLKVLPDTG